MAPVPQYAWAIDQAGVKLPAAILRGQHYDATSGGTGVGSPRALKVLPQAAPDNTVMILPGGGTAVSTYAGHENQSYQATNFKPQTLEISSTGSSSGGRTDLIIQRWLDPNEEPHPDYDGEYPIPADVAKNLWYWRFECKPGMDRTARFDYPHVKLAEIKRPANTTIVNEGHITDLREIAYPKTKRVIEFSHPPATEDMTLGGAYQTVGTINVPIPEYATVAKVKADLSGLPVLRGWAQARFNATFEFATLETTIMRGHAYDVTHAGTLSGFTARSLEIPEHHRGTVVPFHFRVQFVDQLDNAILRVDAGTSLALDITFEQDVS